MEHREITFSSGGSSYGVSTLDLARLAATAVVTRRSYSSNPWRAIVAYNGHDLELCQDVEFDHPMLGPTRIQAPIMGRTKRECTANLDAFRVSLAEALTTPEPPAEPEPDPAPDGPVITALHARGVAGIQHPLTGPDSDPKTYNRIAFAIGPDRLSLGQSERFTIYPSVFSEPVAKITVTRRPGHRFRIVPTHPDGTRPLGEARTIHDERHAAAEILALARKLAS